MDKNIQKKMITVGAIVLALILLILILLVVLSNKNEKKSINFSMGNKTSNQVSEENKNTVENVPSNKTTDPREKIEGEIEFVEISEEEKLPVPPTFKYIEGEFKTGAVIEDKDGNQFVWIPVNEEIKYERILFEHNGEDTDLEEIEKLNLNDINSYNSDFDKSVEKYNGFYIARFEAGKEDDNDLPVSKANVLPWTQVVWEKAKKLSSSMYIENDYFQTDLVNSYAWDTTCIWMEKAEINVDDSTVYGNYQNSSDGLNKVVETGSNDRWKINNIYDMGGNAWEYTTEEYGDHEKYHIGRGGGYWNSGDTYPISTRGTSEDVADLNIGFRVVMYLK